MEKERKTLGLVAVLIHRGNRLCDSVSEPLTTAGSAWQPRTLLPVSLRRLVRLVAHLQHLENVMRCVQRRVVHSDACTQLWATTWPR